MIPIIPNQLLEFGLWMTMAGSWNIIKMNPKTLYQSKRQQRIRGIGLHWLVSKNNIKILKWTLKPYNNPNDGTVFEESDCIG